MVSDRSEPASEPLSLILMAFTELPRVERREQRSYDIVYVTPGLITCWLDVPEAVEGGNGTYTISGTEGYIEATELWNQFQSLHL